MRSKMSRLLLTASALGVAVFSAGSWGQVAEHPVLLALSKTDHTLSIVDPITLKVIAKNAGWAGSTRGDRISRRKARVGFQYAEQSGT